MAVSFSANGYFRSDFMISDAAMPMRLEEMEQEQAAGFAELLGTVATEAVSEGEPQEENLSAVPELIDKDVQDIAKLLILGKIKLEDVPEEMLNEVLIEVAKLQKTGFEVDEDEEEEVPLEKTQELMAATTCEPTTDSSAELMAIIASVSTEKPAEQPQVQMQVQNVQNVVLVDEQATTPIVLVAEEIPTEQMVQVAQNVQQTVEQPVQKMDRFEAQQTTAPTEQTVTEAPVQNMAQGAQTQSDTAQQQNGGEAERTLDAEQAKVLNVAAEKGEIEKPVVRVAEQQVKQESAPVEEQQTEQPVIRTERERVVSVTEELEMLKSAKPAVKQETQQIVTDAEAQPMALAEAPVFITRTDGEQVEVRPTEVAAQAMERMAETAKTMPEGETEYSITLNPEDLGRITVKLTKTADGAVSVTVAAENTSTLRILEQNSQLMQENLRSNGIQLEQWQTVNESQQETYAQDYNGSSKNPYHREDSTDNNGENAEESSFAELIASM